MTQSTQYPVPAQQKHSVKLPKLRTAKHLNDSLFSNISLCSSGHLLGWSVSYVTTGLMDVRIVHKYVGNFLCVYPNHSASSLIQQCMQRGAAVKIAGDRALFSNACICNHTLSNTLPF